MTRFRILVIEDDESISSSLAKALKKWDFEVILPHDFRHVLEEFLNYKPHLVLIDIGLPYYDGYMWCEKIRKNSKVPIIFISSKSDNLNQVMALNMGADDFVAKPFDMEVLITKIQALLRRSYDYQIENDFSSFKDVVLVKDESRLEYKDQKLELTKNELRILSVLFENKSKVTSRELLMQKLWQTDIYVDDNTLSVNMTRLRQKLETIGLNEFIITRKGLGYSLNEDI